MLKITSIKNTCGEITMVYSISISVQLLSQMIRVKATVLITLQEALLNPNNELP